MNFSGILSKLFKRSFGANSEQDNGRRKKHSGSSHNKNPSEESVFEISHTIEMRDNKNIISGNVSRGTFKTGDEVKVCSPLDKTPKMKAVIVNIKTTLVEVNKIGMGTEVDFLIETLGNTQEIIPGDKVYKI